MNKKSCADINIRFIAVGYAQPNKTEQEHLKTCLDCRQAIQEIRDSIDIVQTRGAQPTMTAKQIT